MVTETNWCREIKCSYTTNEQEKRVFTSWNLVTDVSKTYYMSHFYSLESLLLEEHNLSIFNILCLIMLLLRKHTPLQYPS